MNEKENPKENPEAFKTFEADHSARHGAPERKGEQVEVSQSQETAKSEKMAESARHEILRQSAEKDKLQDMLKAEDKPQEENYANRPANADLRKTGFNNEIRHIRRKLNKSDRLGSKLIHQPVIRAVSEVSSKTITRPSGLLGGGITAFIGTSAYLFYTKYIGLKYNYSIFLFLLVAGFILGLVIEAVFRVAKGRSAS